MKHFKIYELDVLSDPHGFILQGPVGEPMDAVCGIKEKRGKFTIFVNQDHPAMRNPDDRDWVLQEICQEVFTRALRHLSSDPEESRPTLYRRIKIKLVEIDIKPVEETELRLARAE